MIKFESLQQYCLNQIKEDGINYKEIIDLTVLIDRLMQDGYFEGKNVSADINQIIKEQHKIDLPFLQKSLFTNKRFTYWINKDIKCALLYDALDEEQLKEFMTVRQNNSNGYYTWDRKPWSMYIRQPIINSDFYKLVYMSYSKTSYPAHELVQKYLKLTFGDIYGTKEYFENFYNCNPKNYRGEDFSFLKDNSLFSHKHYQEYLVKYSPYALEIKEGSPCFSDAAFMRKFILEANAIEIDFVWRRLPLSYLKTINDEQMISRLIKTGSIDYISINNKNWYTSQNLQTYLEYNKLPQKKLYSFLLSLSKINPQFKEESFYKSVLTTEVEARAQREKKADNINEIIKTKLWNKYFEKKENIEIYFDFMLKVKNGFYLPEFLIQDIDLTLKMCKKYPELNIEDKIISYAKYNKDFIMHYLAKVTNNGAKQDLPYLKKIISPDMVTFFEAIGIHENCYDFLKTYFEKKDLENSLNPNEDIFELNIEQEKKTNNILQVNLNIIKAPEKEIKKTNKFKL